MMNSRVPVSTYRLQFNWQFDFAAARQRIAYLNRLGISDIYASPIFESSRRSPHGYDVVNPTRINPELGNLEDFERLGLEIRRHNMGLLLDIVPNHMAISSRNPFWMELLENGRSSPSAEFFDIDWDSCGGKETKNKIILPILGKPYRQALEEGEILLLQEDGLLFIGYYEFRFPVRLESYAAVLSFNSGALETDGLHSGQLQCLISDLSGLSDTENNYRQRQVLKTRIRNLFLGSAKLLRFLEDSVALFNGRRGNRRSFNRLDDLLNRQMYRLESWQIARAEINYRRFFDINTLIGVRVEIPWVMEATHALVFQLIKDGWVTGLRIDHIDGLYDPCSYLQRLQQLMVSKEKEGVLAGSVAQGQKELEIRNIPLEPAGSNEMQSSFTSPFYVVAEKILSGDERLPEDWQLQGTTGYDFARAANGVLVDDKGLEELDQAYRLVAGSDTNFAEVVYHKKKQVIEELFPGELQHLACQINELVHPDGPGLDPLKETLKEIIACLPIYRTYIRSGDISRRDREYLQYAFREAERRSPALHVRALDVLKKFLFLEFPPHYSELQQKKWLRLVMRWQQFTGPITAKGLEDTALYSYNRLLSLNVIGADLDLAAVPVSNFHKFNSDRQRRWPNTLNNTSTHDSKRSEDVDARINVLAEMPHEWNDHLGRWRELNGAKKRIIGKEPVPEPNMDELIYQSLIGAWPEENSQQQRDNFKERFKGFILKAAREAKSRTSWISPAADYEAALGSFVESILNPSDNEAFLADFIPFQKKVAYYGAINSLSQLLLKITCPGVPDFYQGTERWNFSLVDPDNRHPVDFTKNESYLNEIQRLENDGLTGLLDDMQGQWEDGRIKLYLTYRGLNFRSRNSELFQKGEYLPLEARGRNSGHILAFARRYENRWAITVAPRLAVGLTSPGKLSLNLCAWGEDYLHLPADVPTSWRNILTGQSLRSPEHTLRLAEVFSGFPVALLENNRS
jgi:(1->4)-alpha-D-glucan 1-alpha-D-glucosylmutase